MSESIPPRFSRREFLASTSMLGAATVLGLPRIAAAEPPPETTKIRLVHTESICLAPQYLAEELLRLEGFAEVEYVRHRGGQASSVLAAGQADVTMQTVPGLILKIDAGEPVVLIAGVHAGCYELFAHQRIQSVRDLKGRSSVVLTMTCPIFFACSSCGCGGNPRKASTLPSMNRRIDSTYVLVMIHSTSLRGSMPT